MCVMTAPIVLVSCVKSKRDHRCRAGDMYTSAPFQKMMAYAQSLKPNQVYILSHGARGVLSGAKNPGPVMAMATARRPATRRRTPRPKRRSRFSGVGSETVRLTQSFPCERCAAIVTAIVTGHRPMIRRAGGAGTTTWIAVDNH
jgi:hypothetical protein